MTKAQSQAEYRKAKRVWYRKLKATGFKDIEMENGGLRIWSRRLPALARAPTLNVPQPFCEAKAQYYRLCGFFLHDWKFANALEREIWTIHCDGRGVGFIWKELRKRRPKLRRYKVRWVLQNLNNEMRRYYGVGLVRDYKNPGPRRCR